MKSVVSKSGIIAVFLILSNCGNNSPISTIHPLMILEEARLNDTSRVSISTTVAKDYSMYRIVDGSCIVAYPWTIMNEDSSYSPVIDSVKITNDSAASQSGTFHGIWAVPDSLFKYGPLRINVYLLDEANHTIYDTLTVFGPFSTP